jgi:hypothetical protein
MSELCSSVVVSCCFQKFVAEARGQFGNPKEGEIPSLEAVPRQQPVKTQQTGNT